MNFRSYLGALKEEQLEIRAAVNHLTEDPEKYKEFLTRGLDRLDSIIARLEALDPTLAQAYGGRALKIAILDDDFDLAPFAPELKNRRIEAKVFRTFSTLKRSMGRQKFDGLLLDVRLGHISGIDLIPKIREFYAGDIILFTILVDSGVVFSGRRAGAIGVISKFKFDDGVSLATEIRSYFGEPLEVIDESRMRQLADLLKRFAPLLDESAKQKIVRAGLGIMHRTLSGVSA
jgi:response regulator of citrate/malate metabolism